MVMPGDFPEEEKPEPPSDDERKEQELARIQELLDAGLITQADAVDYLDKFETYLNQLTTLTGAEAEAEAWRQYGELQTQQVGIEKAYQAGIGGRFLDKKNAILAQDISWQAKSGAIKSLVQEYWAQGVPGIASVQYFDRPTGLHQQILESLSPERRKEAEDWGQLERGTGKPIPSEFDIGEEPRLFFPGQKVVRPPRQLAREAEESDINRRFKELSQRRQQVLKL